LARIQQQVLEKGKSKWQRAATSSKHNTQLQKNDNGLLANLQHCGRRGKQEITEGPMGYAISVLNPMMQITRLYVPRNRGAN
jgi:hypothetical protein